MGIKVFANKVFLHYGLLLLSLSLLLILIFSMDFEYFLASFDRLKPVLYVQLIIIFSIAWLIRSSRLNTISEVSISLWNSFKLQIMGSAINLLYPLKLGDLLAARYYQGNHTKKEFDKALGDIMHLRIMDFIVLSWILIAGVTYYYFGFSEVISISLSFSVIPMFAFLLLNLSKHIETRDPRPKNKFLSMLIGFSLRITSFHKFSPAYFFVVLTTLGIWFFEALVTYFLTLSMNIDLTFSDILIVIAAANLAKSLPIFPGGIGTYEGAFVLGLTSLGYPYAEALTLAVFDHAFKKVYNLCIGFPFYLGLKTTHLDPS